MKMYLMLALLLAGCCKEKEEPQDPPMLTYEQLQTLALSLSARLKTAELERDVAVEKAEILQREAEYLRKSCHYVSEFPDDGDNIVFTIISVGSEPIAYFWRKKRETTDHPLGTSKK